MSMASKATRAVIPLDPSKTVRFVTLPNNPDLHVFAMAIGGS